MATVRVPDRTTRESVMKILVLTGAGISAESGLGTFRDKGGLWSRFDPMKLATPEAFAKHPEQVHAFYNLRRRNVLDALPNPAHFALARLDAGLAEHGDELTLVTENIDDLHERAGTSRVTHMHGELLKTRCAHCEGVRPWRWDLAESDRCPGCGQCGHMRPHVVWFGEIPLEMDAIQGSLRSADLFVAIGTSGAVYPAAGFVAQAGALGITTCEINLEPSDNAELFDERRYGRASEVVPAWVEEVSAGRDRRLFFQNLKKSALSP
jgi:NAD-dependent deacetylase